jgi:hypothetical protein
VAQNEEFEFLRTVAARASNVNERHEHRQPPRMGAPRLPPSRQTLSPRPRRTSRSSLCTPRAFERNVGSITAGLTTVSSLMLAFRPHVFCDMPATLAFAPVPLPLRERHQLFGHAHAAGSGSAPVGALPERLLASAS